MGKSKQTALEIAEQAAIQAAIKLQSQLPNNGK